MNIIREQKKFWDEESVDPSYCDVYTQGAKVNRWRDMFLQIEKTLPDRIYGNVLELGGGSQFISRFLAENRNCQIICTDISDKRIEDFNNYYNQKLSNLTTVGNINAENLPFDDEQFDFIIGDAMLHHIEDLRSALFELNRCLKPGGTAIFIREPVVGHLTPILRDLKKWFSDPKVTQIKDAIFIQDNRYEYDKTILQWKEEFYRSGFKASIFKGWYWHTSKELFKTTFPTLFTCLVSFRLNKAIDLRKFK
jgi:ubiquinone/menaquinone biosynthesis C-methylase UbiE